MNGAAYISNIRPVNAVVWPCRYPCYDHPTGSVPAEFFFIFLIILTITGAGNVINDYYDREIDAINQPSRPIPSGKISPGHARIYAVFLFLAGNGIAIWFMPQPIAAILILSFSGYMLRF